MVLLHAHIRISID